MKTESQIRTEGHGYKGQTLFRLSSIAVLAIMPFFYNSYCDHRNVQKKIQYQETVKMPAEIEKICADLDKNPTQQQKAGYRICRDFDSYKVISDDSDLIHPNLCESRETDYKIDDHMEDDNPTIIPRQMLVEREQNYNFILVKIELMN